MGQNQSVTTANWSYNWSSQPAVFHHQHGNDIRLSENNTVAERAKRETSYYGVVMTAEPVPIGMMFQVTVLEKEKNLLGGLRVALTTQNPEKTCFFGSLYEISRYKKEYIYWLYRERTVHYNSQEKIVSINLDDLHAGQSVGLLVSRNGDLHLFVDGKHSEMVWRCLPTDQPLWGAADVYGKCSKIKADILCDKEAQVHHLQQRLSEVTQQLSDISREKDVQVQEKDAQIQHHRQRLSTPLPRTHSQEIEFWCVSAKEVQVDQGVLGRGAWGYVTRGTFRGQQVAVKKVYPDILKPHTMDRIRREISTMAQVRHPNLVLFIAAVLDDRTGPMIITEILDTSLRTAYEKNWLGSNKLRVFRDVASALDYLHLHRQPIIHRDVSTVNVLLEALANNVWKAKLSDFGSANLVRYATTPGEGAIIYTAPEAFPQPPTSPTPPPPQTPKIDVYSYGVLLGEVITQELPNPGRLQEMVEEVQKLWPQMHPLVTSCIEHSPEKRPTMSNVLKVLDQKMEENEAIAVEHGNQLGSAWSCQLI